MRHWQFIGNHLQTGYLKPWVKLIMIGKTLVQQIRVISHYSNNMGNVIKGIRLVSK